VQPREDTGLSPAEAVFGAQIVLPNEFLQNDELPVDNFSKTLYVSAPSLPRHNSRTNLPSKLPVELLSSPLVCVRGGASFHLFIRSTTAPMLFCAAAPTPSPSKLGRGMRWLPSATSRPARQRAPCLAARYTPADRWACA
jgi:hypothetical protein